MCDGIISDGSDNGIKCEHDTRIPVPAERSLPEAYSGKNCLRYEAGNGACKQCCDNPISVFCEYKDNNIQKSHDAIVKKKTIEEILLWRKENRGKKLGYCTNGMIEDQFLTELIDKDSWSIEEHDHLISTQAAKRSNHRRFLLRIGL